MMKNNIWTEQILTRGLNQESKPPNKQKFKTKDLHCWILTNTQKRITTNHSQTLPKCRRGGNSFKFILQGQHYPDTKTRQGCHKERKIYASTLRSIDTKILNKIIEKWIQQYSKRIIHHDQVRFIQGMQGQFKICKSGKVIHHINKMKIIWSSQ